MEEGSVHALLIVTTSGNVVVSRHFLAGTSEEERDRTEQRVCELTRDMWASMRTDQVRVAAYDAESGPRTVVFTLCNDVLLFVVGSGEYDELALADALAATVAVLRATCCRDGVTEAAVFKEYRDVLLCIDDIFARGVVNLTDPDLVHASLAMELEKARR